MNTTEQKQAGDAAHTPTRYYWQQCYEVGDSVHWALCDTASDSEKPRKVSSAYMVLLADYKTAIGGKPVSKEPLLVKIVDALNAYDSDQRQISSLVVELQNERLERANDQRKIKALVEAAEACENYAVDRDGEVCVSWNAYSKLRAALALAKEGQS